VSQQPAEAERVAALQQQAAADYARAQQQQDAARQQLVLARIHGNEAASTR